MHCLKSPWLQGSNTFLKLEIFSLFFSFLLVYLQFFFLVFPLIFYSLLGCDIIHQNVSLSMSNDLDRKFHTYNLEFSLSRQCFYPIQMFRYNWYNGQCRQCRKGHGHKVMVKTRGVTNPTWPTRAHIWPQHPLVIFFTHLVLFNSLLFTPI